MNYTSVEQSKKLLELGLSPESADMFYQHIPELKSWDSVPEVAKYIKESIAIPCWSVGALLEVMPEKIKLDNYEAFYKLKRENTVWRLYYESAFSYRENQSIYLIEAAYNMVIWLLENNYIKQ